MAKISKQTFSPFKRVIKCLILLNLAVLCSNTYLQGQTNQLDNPWTKFTTTPYNQTLHRNVGERTDFLLFASDVQISKEELSKRGVTIYRILDSFHAVITLPAKPVTNPSLPSGQLWYTNELWKLSPELLTKEGPLQKTLMIRCLDQNKVLGILQTAGLSHQVRLAKNHPGLLYFDGDLSTARQLLLPLETVYYIGAESTTPLAESRALDMNLNVNRVNRILHEYPSINGAGVTVSVQEQRYDTTDLDIKGRNLNSELAAPGATSHATEMATVIAGAGNSSLLGRGVSREAILTPSDFADILPDAADDYTSLNTYLQNHSYGTSIENFYGAQAEAYDISANTLPDLLHVFSSGNQGTGTDTSGTYNGVNNYANLTGNFKHAKNVLVVGSVDTVGSLISFVSRGPAYDGRLKPELVAYSVVGSSNSAALVSGVAALLQQAYRENNGGNNPSASLLKALLINSARDVGPEGIDFSTGYGEMDAYASLQTLLNNRYLEASLSSGVANQHMITVPANARNLRVSLTWNDPAANPNAATALVNDLDMVLSSPTGSDFLPWVLDASPNVPALSSLPTRAEDHLNVIEHISIDAPEAGTYTITVSPFDLPDGPQDYAIAWQYELNDTFAWTFPTGSDNLPYNGESGSYFRWESTLAASTGTLQYSTDDGANWITIAADLDLSKGFQRWDAPQINSKAIARMVTADGTFLTEHFSISRPLRPAVGFDCPDSLMLSWPVIENASSYEISKMGARYLELYTTTSDTSLILSRDQVGDGFFSIQPILQDGHPSIPSPTFNVANQGANCYLNTFFASVAEVGADLNLFISSTYGVTSLRFEHFENGAFAEIARIDNPGTTSLVVNDPNPLEGQNLYRAVVVLQNGEEIISDVSEIYFVIDSEYLLFPNPVRQDQELRIFIPTPDFSEPIIFTIYDRTGKNVVVRQFTTDQEYIPLFGIEPGLYLFSIVQGESVKAGRFVIY